jgi:RNA polymerase sigma factor (sigma-70 family)
LEASVIRAPEADRSLAPAVVRSLYERYGQRVLTFCLSRMRDREDAQDAAQTTFVYALTALERGVVPRHELAWLLKIADNACRASRRSLGRRAVTSFADVTEVEAAAQSLAPETREQLHELREALELLPESQRRAVLLREWQGLSYAEMSDELGVSVSAVETLLFRARQALTANLERVRSRLVDLGLALAGLRSWLPRGTSGLAAGAAVVGLAAAPAFVPREGDAATRERAVAAAAPARAAAPAPVPTRSKVARRPAVAVAPPARRPRLSGERAGKAAAAPARATPRPAAPSRPASPAAATPVSSPPRTSAGGSGAAPAPPATSQLPVAAPLPPEAEPVVGPVAAPVVPAVSAVVTTVENATASTGVQVPPLPPPPSLP